MPFRFACRTCWSNVSICASQRVLHTLQQPERNSTSTGVIVAFRSAKGPTFDCGAFHRFVLFLCATRDTEKKSGGKAPHSKIIARRKNGVLSRSESRLLQLVPPC